MLCHLSKTSISHWNLLIRTSRDIGDFMCLSLFSLDDVLVCLIDNVWDLIRIVRWRWPGYVKVLLYHRFSYFDKVRCSLLAFSLVCRLCGPNWAFGHYLLGNLDLRIFLYQLLLWLVIEWWGVRTVATSVLSLTHFTRMVVHCVVVIAQLRGVLNLVPQDRAMINNVTILCEGPKLRRVLFDCTQPWNAKLFLWWVFGLCSISNEVPDLIVALLEGLFVSLQDPFESLFNVC